MTLIGLSLLSQPAQAINWNFSYSNDSGNSFTGTLISDGSSASANTIYNLTGISGTVTNTNNGSSALVSAISSYNGANNKFVWDGGTAIALDFSGISFTDANAENYQVFAFGGGAGTTLSDFSTTNLAVDNTAGTNGDITSSSLTPAAVPEPLTILGAVTAAGFGAGFKRKLAKSIKKQCK